MNFFRKTRMWTKWWVYSVLLNFLEPLQWSFDLSSCLQAQFWWISLPRQDCENDGVNSVLWISWNICNPLSIPSACNWNFGYYSWRQQSGQAICFDLPEKNVDRMLRFALFCWILVDTLQSFNLLSLQLQLWMICLKATICSALCFNPSDENVN